MDELKLLEKMLRDKEKGLLQDFRGDEYDSSQEVAPDAANSPDGIVQAFLDELRWAKTDELVDLIWDPESQSSVARLYQRTAMQVLLEREGDEFVRRIIREQRQAERREDEWLRGRSMFDQQSGEFSGAGAMEPRRANVLKDAKGQIGGVKRAGRQVEDGKASARELKAVMNESMVTGSSESAWGHMESWITDRAKAVEKDGVFKVKLEALDLHTKIYIRSKHDAAWSDIEDFEDFYGGPHDTAFATYEGVLLHESQHEKERTDVFLAHLAKFRDQVEHIEAESEEEAIERYMELFEQFEREQDEEYFEIGEIPARTIEWEYYHAQYEEATGARGVSRSSARSAGAKLGKEETAKAQESMMMAARASDRPAVGNRTRGRRVGGAAPSRAVGTGSKILQYSGDGRWSSEGDRPKLLGTIRDTAARLSGGGFSGSRPVFGVGSDTRITGAKVGVPLPSVANWLDSTRASEEHGSAEAEGAVRWLRQWWASGAVDH